MRQAKRMGSRRPRAAEFEPLEFRRLLAANLLADAAGLSAANSVTVDGTSYFFADNGVTGRELWKSDGTLAGTKLIKDLTPGAAGTELFAIHHGEDGTVVFVTVVHNGVSNGHYTDDYTLWSSDGTAAGTVKLREFKATMHLLTRQLGDMVLILQNTESPYSQQEDTTLVDAHLFVTDGTGASEIKSLLATPSSAGVSSADYMVQNWFDGNGRVVFGANGRLWSSDGTAAGTSDVTTGDLATAADHFQVDFSRMVQLDDRKVLMPSSLGAGSFWITDGTAGGTTSAQVTIQGVILPGDSNVVVNGKYLFVEMYGDRRTLWAFDVATQTLSTVYEVNAHSTAHGISIYKVGSRAIFIDSVTPNDGSDSTTLLYSTDGTAAGTTKLAEFNGFLAIDRPTVVGGTAFFVVSAGFQTDGNGQATGWVSGWNYHAITSPAQVSLDLWRTDGTAANTGMVKTIWKGDPTGKIVSATLSEADGKLLIRTQVQTSSDINQYPSNPGVISGTLFDDTSAYDDRELTFGRQGASARLVNGVLQIRGSYNDDHIRIWRSQRMPDRLVVEYNGNERSFPFSSIRQINVDLQDGNDYFQVLEGEGQVIRTRTSILGGDGSDTIFGGTGRDTIYAGNSGDLIYGRGNADVILAGGGRDRVNAGAGDDQVAGGSGVDRVVGGAGVDVLFGQNAVEMAFGQDVEGKDLLDDVLLT
jgi:ELWxxDGT repeat protein